MLSSVIMRTIALLMENQKWEISFKIIDSRKFWVVRPKKMIIDSYNGRDLQFSLGFASFKVFQLHFTGFSFRLPLIRAIYLFIAAQNSKTLKIANTTYYLFAAFLISGDLELAAIAHTGSSCPSTSVSNI